MSTVDCRTYLFKNKDNFYTNCFDRRTTESCLRQIFGTENYDNKDTDADKSHFNVSQRSYGSMFYPHQSIQTSPNDRPPTTIPYTTPVDILSYKIISYCIIIIFLILFFMFIFKFFKYQIEFKKQLVRIDRNLGLGTEGDDAGGEDNGNDNGRSTCNNTRNRNTSTNTYRAFTDNFSYDVNFLRNMTSRFNLSPPNAVGESSVNVNNSSLNDGGEMPSSLSRRNAVRNHQSSVNVTQARRAVSTNNLTSTAVSANTRRQSTAYINSNQNQNISIFGQNGKMTSFSFDDLPPKYSELISQVSKIKSDGAIQNNIIILANEQDSKSLG